MAAGRGGRLGSRTRTIPKPLVAVNGSPMLDSLLGRLESINVRCVFISVHYLAEKIEAFIETRENKAEF
jgi:MurNAc alpha-1-phosphate uridylyltransferase